jgi:hypothetical protein
MKIPYSKTIVVTFGVLVLIVVSIGPVRFFIFGEEDNLVGSPQTSQEQIDSIPEFPNYTYDPQQYVDFASFLREFRRSDEVAENNPFSDSELYDGDRDHTRVGYEYFPSTIIEPEPLQKFTPQVLPVSSTLRGFANVEGIDPGQTNVATNQTFSVEFDEAPNESIISALEFFPSSEFTASLEGTTLTVTPQRLDRNSVYTFGASFSTLCTFDESNPCDNTDEVTADFPFSFSFSTDWKERYIYGNSVWGTPLESFIFGFGDQTGKVMMLTGGIHGSEWRAGDLTQLKDYLWTRPEELLGQNKTIIIVPFMNPDGTALGIRYNARGVNLNRNYYSYWQPCSFCGYKPHSEPETYHWARFAQAEGTTHLISYHAQWPPFGIIFKGQDNNPNINFFAQWVSDRTGYPVGYYPGDQFISSDIVPGDQTVWSADWGVESILIEAKSVWASDWEMNFPMYLALIRQY